MFIRKTGSEWVDRYVQLMLRDPQRMQNLHAAIVALGVPTHLLVPATDEQGKSSYALRIAEDENEKIEVRYPKPNYDVAYLASHQELESIDPMSFTPMAKAGLINIKPTELEATAKGYGIAVDALFAILAFHETVHFLMMQRFADQRSDWVSEGARSIHETIALGVVESLLGNGHTNVGVGKADVAAYLENVKAVATGPNAGPHAQAYAEFFQLKDKIVAGQTLWQAATHGKEKYLPRG